jgi:hypothetical protein
MDWSFRSFVHQAVPVALKEEIAVQTVKPMGGRFILESKTVTPSAYLRYALSQPALVAAMTRKYELFKTTATFDSTAKDPTWLG